MSDSTPGTSRDGGLGKLLKAAFQVGASDIHLKVGQEPMFRVNGDLRAVEFPRVQLADLEAFASVVTGRPVEALRAQNQFEFSYEWESVGRFRGHYYTDLGKPAIAFRPIPLTVPSMKDLRLPIAVKRLTQLSHGLIVVTGATGMGKSTTIACMLEAIAATSCRHIITIEDPVEFVIHEGRSMVNQREVGRDVESYREGLRSALRQDPDVVLIGEARDRETMDVVLHAAQSGHLVLASAHFTDVTAAISGIVGIADRSEQLNWRSRLADCLQAVISQRLIPLADGRGRVLATEVMTSEPSVRACILDETKSKTIRACLERGRAENLSHTMDQCLLELLESKLIRVEVARSAAISPGELMREVNLRRLA